MYRKPCFPSSTQTHTRDSTPAMLEKSIQEAKHRLGYNLPDSKPGKMADFLGE